MKLCFSTLGCTDRSLEDILALAAKYNISALEIRGIGGILNNSEIAVFSDDMAKNTMQLLSDRGISLQVLGTSCAFHNPDKYDASVAEGREAVRIAEKFDIPGIRVFGDRATCGSTERIISGISELCALSDSVSILLEVHGDYNTEEAILPIIEKLKNNKNFGLIWDIEHTHKPYGDRWEEFYTAFRPYIRHVHIKDYSDTDKCLTLIGHGSVPIVSIIRRLKDDLYDGYISLEWEKKWHPELPDIENALESFLEVVKEGEI